MLIIDEVMGCIGWWV